MGFIPVGFTNIAKSDPTVNYFDMLQSIRIKKCYRLAKKNFLVTVIKMREALNHDLAMKSKELKEDALKALEEGKALAKEIRDKKKKLLTDLELEWPPEGV